MILKIRHKGLRRLYKTGSKAKINPDRADELELILGILETSSTPEDVNVPGLRLHQLKGEYEGFYAVDVSGNWRVVFRFEGDHVTDVDYLDSH